MEDLKNISYDNLKRLIEATKTHFDEIDRLSTVTNECLNLWENSKIMGLEEEIVHYLDSILPDSYEASYFVFECEYGAHRINGEPMSIKMNDKEYPITDFDSWYYYLLEEEKDDSE